MFLIWDPAPRISFIFVEIKDRYMCYYLAQVLENPEE
jgi:hypothetical protein